MVLTEQGSFAIWVFSIGMLMGCIQSARLTKKYWHRDMRQQYQRWQGRKWIQFSMLAVVPTTLGTGAFSLVLGAQVLSQSHREGFVHALLRSLVYFSIVALILSAGCYASLWMVRAPKILIPPSLRDLEE